jgi:hypothetical protein
MRRTMDEKPSKEMMRSLVLAGILEALCFVAGLVAFFATGKWIWIVIGIVAGLGFSIQALIKYFRERDRASR